MRLFFKGCVLRCFGSILVFRGVEGEFFVFEGVIEWYIIVFIVVYYVLVIGLNIVYRLFV